MVHSETTRPPVKKNALDTFYRVFREPPGYAPSTALELMEWVKERVCIISVEWDELCAHLNEIPVNREIFPITLTGYVVSIPGAHMYDYCCQSLPRLCHILEISIDQLHPMKVFTETKQRGLWKIF